MREGAGLRAAAAVLALAVLIPAAGLPAEAALTALPPHDDRSVYDLAGVISAGDAGIMEGRHKELFGKTGVAIVVLTVPGLEGETIEQFAVRAGSGWGVGRRKEDRGIVVALAMRERRVFIATGYGVEGYLPDGRVGEILDSEVVPELKAGDASKAMLGASEALVAASAAEYRVTIEGVGERGPRPAGREAANPWLGLFALLGLALLIILFVRHPWLLLFLLQSSGRGGFGGGGLGGGGFGGGGLGGGGFGGGGFGGGGAGRGF